MLLSAELRWFWQGTCPPQVERFFHDSVKYSSEPESRLDRYLPQKGRNDIGIKARGTKAGAEIKARVAVIRDDTLIIAPSFEIWGKWDADLSITNATEVKKLRWSRAFDTQVAEAVEIPVQTDEQACHVELTKLELMRQSDVWWTLGFEALGDLGAVQDNLRKLVQRLAAGGLPIEGGEFMAYPAWLDRIAQGR